jgi:hypothetical protein
VRRAVLAGAAAALVALGAAGAALVVERHPGAPGRLRAVAAGGVRRLTGDSPAAGGPDGAAAPQPRRPARLACVPAVAVGRPGELRSLAGLGAAERATALFQWAPGRATAAAERGAVQALGAQRGAAVAAVGRRGAVAATADGATLRALAARAPGAAAQLAAAGTRELCALD